MVEEQILPSSAVAEVLNESYIEARIHTDHDELGEKHRQLQTDLVNKLGNPYYVILDPDTGKKIDVYTLSSTTELKDNSAMLEFLKRGLGAQ